VGVLTGYAGPLNFSTGKLANSVIVPGRVLVYGFTVYSTKASAQFLNIFDSNTVPVDTSVPLFSMQIAANAGVGFQFFPCRQFQTGLCITNSSTDATKTIGSVDCFFDVQFDIYEEQNAPGTGE